MNNFDEWIDKNYPSVEPMDAWDYQQAKIDELQARIDGALQLLEYNEYVDSALQAIDILKGNKDEN